MTSESKEYTLAASASPAPHHGSIHGMFAEAYEEAAAPPASVASAAHPPTVWWMAAARYVRHRLSPSRIRADWRPRHSHIALQVAYSVITLLLFALLYYYNGFAGTIAGYGAPQELTCHYIGWGGCGINGADCQPFDEPLWSAVRCPHRCKLPGTKGAVIGGANGVYKGDSHICQSALHAGVIDDSTGGCFLYRSAGMHTAFPSGGSRHGIGSSSFLSWFPGSMAFSAVDSSYCSNFGLAILLVGIVWMFPLACMKPHAMLVWFLMLTWGFWYCTLTLTDSGVQRDLFWNANANCWIVGVFGYVLYHLSAKHTLYVTPEYYAAALTEWPWKICFSQKRCRRLVHSHSRVPGSVGVSAASGGGSTGGMVEVAPRLSLSHSSGEEGPPSRSSVSRSLQAPLVSFSIDNTNKPVGAETHQDTSADYFPPLSAPAATTKIPSSVPAPSSTPAAASPPVLILRPWFDIYFLYMLPMFAAFHFTYLPYVPGIADIDLDSKFFSHGAKGTVLILVVLVVMIFVTIYHMKMAWEINILFKYLLYYSYVVMVVIGVSALFASSATFHLHHVLAGILLIPMSRFPSRISLVFQAIAAGIFINGLAVWGFSAAWDVHNPSNATVLYTRADNPPPNVVQVTNSTANSVFIAWPVAESYSAAIGSSLVLNGIEILHTTYDDSTYGGGFTPTNSSSNSSSSLLTQPLISLQHAVMSVKPKSGRAWDTLSRLQQQQQHSDASASLLASMPLHMKSMRIELLSDHEPTQVALPSYPRVSKHVRALANSRPARSPLIRTWHTADLTASEHEQRAVSLSSSFDSTSSSLVSSSLDAGYYWIFQLVNLFPNTSYTLTAGYIMPGGWGNYGDTILIRTDGETAD